MRLSDRGIDTLKRLEGFREKAYQDIAGVWTIGYGHTGGVYEGQVISEEEGERLLRDDVIRFEDCVTAAVTRPLEQHEFDALVIFSFNIGCGAFKGSTACRWLNEGRDMGKVGGAMQWWHRAGGRKHVLSRRRNIEYAILVDEIYE